MKLRRNSDIGHSRWLSWLVDGIIAILISFASVPNRVKEQANPGEVIEPAAAALPP
jgi:hypothetical protein